MSAAFGPALVFGSRIRRNSLRIVGHGGGAPGIGAAIDLYPDLGYVVVTLANQDDVITPVHDKTCEILALAN